MGNADQLININGISQNMTHMMSIMGGTTKDKNVTVGVKNVISAKLQT